eukprot:358534-Chlamydomonas_euryale.AAC.4
MDGRIRRVDGWMDGRVNGRVNVRVDGRVKWKCGWTGERVDGRTSAASTHPFRVDVAGASHANAPTPHARLCHASSQRPVTLHVRSHSTSGHTPCPVTLHDAPPMRAVWGVGEGGQGQGQRGGKGGAHTSTHPHIHT